MPLRAETFGTLICVLYCVHSDNCMADIKVAKKEQI